jgi:hypothetical protein
MTTTNKAGIEAAEQAGRAAFAAGIIRAPALDAAVAKLLAGRTGGEQVPVLLAWLRGWDRANLASISAE